MSPTGAATALPMFPLQSLLLPATVVPLHVFEPRYRALVGHCLEGDGALGTVLIERGSEVGGGDQRFAVGTRARLVAAEATADGRWLVVVAGESRLRVSRWLGESPFPRAEVEDLPEQPDPEAAARLGPLAGQVLRAHRLRAELDGEAAPAALPELDADPAQALWQLIALAPLAVLDHQRLLELDGAAERARALARFLDEELAVLARRRDQG